MDKYAKYPYVVVPSPGTYGEGLVDLVSRHATFEAAAARAEKETRELREAFSSLGGTTASYYVAYYTCGDRFWSDQPPECIDGPVTL